MSVAYEPGAKPGHSADAAPPPRVALSPAVKDFLAGAIGGLAGVVAGQPLDTVRVRVQQRGSGYAGALQCWSRTVAREGALSLFRGMSYPLATVAFQNAAAFWGFGAACRALGDEDSVAAGLPLPYSHAFLAGMAGGVASTVVQAPVDLLKIRLQLQHAAPGSPGYVGPLRLAAQVLQRGGLSGLYRGTVITLIRDVPSYGVYFTLYEFTRSCLDPTRRAAHHAAAADGSYHPPHHPSSHHLDAPLEDVGHSVSDGGEHHSPVETAAAAVVPVEDRALDMFLAGGLAGVVSWATVYPFDVVKSRLQATCKQDSSYKGWFDCMRSSYHQEGPQVFTRGMGASLGRAFLVNAAIFTTFESTMKMLP